VEVLFGVQSQFELIRFGLQYLPKSRIKAFYKERLEREMQAWEAFMAEFEKDFPEMKDIVPEVLATERKELRKRYKPSDVRVKKELSEDRLNQSELLLLVAHFESFIKTVHEAFLRAAPGRVFASRDTKFLLREIFDSSGPSLSTRKFLNELVIKEVKALDRESIERKAEYFKEHFGVVFGTKAEIEELKEIMVTRNKISHETYSPPPSALEEIKEQPLVSDKVLTRARHFFQCIPKLCVREGAKRYSSYFRDS